MRQRLKIASVVALVAANLALLFLVGQKMVDSRVEADDRLPPRAPSAPATTDTEPPRAAPGGRQALVVTEDVIFRLFSGSCDGKEGAEITVSSDTGATFDDVGLPEEVRSVFSLAARNADDLDLVAAGEDCEPARYVSTNGGSRWEAAEGADVWFMVPQTKQVTSPEGQVNPGCTENLTISALTDRTARVFCASGALIGTDDGGRTWSRLGTLDGVRAAAYVTRTRAFALAPDGGCATGSYTSDDAGRTWDPVACLDAAPARALAASGDVVVALVGGDILVSEDAGRTWTAP